MSKIRRRQPHPQSHTLLFVCLALGVALAIGTVGTLVVREQQSEQRQEQAAMRYLYVEHELARHALARNSRDEKPGREEAKRLRERMRDCDLQSQQRYGVPALGLYPRLGEYERDRAGGILCWVSEDEDD